MRIGIVCKVIDNYGDAGFSLRLAKALAMQSHVVLLFHDHPLTLQTLCPTLDTDRLTLIDATEAEFVTYLQQPLDLILEPFGTSSSQSPHRFDNLLKERFPSTAWLLIDYLSAEDWVENFHLESSVDPKNGHITTYFYPGFTNKTGGLIHCDYPKHLRQTINRALEKEIKLFVFSYPNAPLEELLQVCRHLIHTGVSIEVGLAGKQSHWAQLETSQKIPFCPQNQFDELLTNYDVLFVRGEDSFVRAQLAGKPFIWQIYPTDDGLHAEKLACFFKRYSKNLSKDCELALWNCWLSWNKLKNCPVFSECWLNLQPHWPELNTHALAWRDALFNGPELVSEVLAWGCRQNSNSHEKPN